MLPLPDFSFLTPKSIDEAVAMLAEHGDKARLIAGGTDLLPNLKHGLLEPPYLVSLQGIPGLANIREEEDGIHLGPLCTLADLRDSPLVQRRLPALAEAAGQIASPQLQNMATLGGNVLLDTRCVYYNQTRFWRRSLGFCLKKDGTACHVVKKGRRCVAAHSSDTAPVLLSLNAELTFNSPRGVQTLPLRKLYKAPGDDHLRVSPDEILSGIRVPIPLGGTRSGFEKLRARKSIDFPLLNLAATFTLSPEGICETFSLYVSALGAVPKNVSKAAKIAVGTSFNDELIDEIAEIARKSCVPLDNINVDSRWRRAMVPNFTRRLLKRLRDQTMEPS